MFESRAETGKFSVPLRPFNPIRDLMNMRSLLFGTAALLALAAGTGCGGDSPSLSSEMDDSSYREGQQMEHQGRWDEALASYLKVIDHRGDAAPEST